MKIAVLTDAHANLPALRAALDAIRAEGCDAIYHTGDAIAIGPQPAECLELMLSMPNLHATLGNHELWYLYGLPQPQPSWMSDGEVVHQHWVHAQIGPALRGAIAQWPLVIEATFDDVWVTLLHWEPARSASGFAPAHRRPVRDQLDQVFGRHRADVLFYGHSHVVWEVSGDARYVNPGSLGCCEEPLARFAILECTRGAYTVARRAVPYDDGPLFAAFEDRRVPDRQFLYRAFFGARYPRGTGDGA
jgi:predicted phosphodiesterase